MVARRTGILHGDFMGPAVFAATAGLLITLSVMPAFGRESFTEWRAGLWPDAQAHGITRATFDRALKGIKPDRSLPDLILPGALKKKRHDRGQAEFIKTPGQYLKGGHLKFLAVRGRRLDVKWRKQLVAIEQRYGVPRSMILAIFGRETAYGSYKLKRDAIRALLTQAKHRAGVNINRDQAMDEKTHAFVAASLSQA